MNTWDGFKPSNMAHILRVYRNTRSTGLPAILSVFRTIQVHLPYLKRAVMRSHGTFLSARFRKKPSLVFLLQHLRHSDLTTASFPHDEVSTA